MIKCEAQTNKSLIKVTENKKKKSSTVTPTLSRHIVPEAFRSLDEEDDLSQRAMCSNQALTICWPLLPLLSCLPSSTYARVW